MLEHNSMKLTRVANESKQRTNATDMHDSKYVMTCNTAITSISNTLKKLLLQSNFHSSYIETIFNGKQESIDNIFSTYVEPLFNDINNTALVQYWTLKLDVEA